ncbi:MAG: class I SAM-dependent methyltransferase [Desulfosalsimonas sp.]
MAADVTSESRHVCPFWIGYLLASPIRRIFQNPAAMLAPYALPGMRILDIGCAMGFFSLPLARMVGAEGRVICLDIQQKMLDACMRRAGRKNLDDRMEARLCRPGSLDVADLYGRIDFALAFAVVHEADNPFGLFSEISDVLKPGGRVLVAEPKGHVSRASFENYIATAESNRLDFSEEPKISLCRAAVFEKRS